MTLIIASKEDPASSSMGDFLVRNYNFMPKESVTDEFIMSDFLLKFIEQKHLYYEGMDEDAKRSGNSTGIIILSKHSSAADIKSLTVHPTGNFGDAQLGGSPGMLSMTDPIAMTEALRNIRNNYKGNAFSVTFEATHHGPFIRTPNYFVEIGTTKDQWEDRGALKAVCDSILQRRGNKFRNYVGIGGGHYMPKITTYALENNVNIGHMIPKYQSEVVNSDIIRQAVSMTPECAGFIMDRKGMKANIREMVSSIARDQNLEIIEI
ncbi:MAG: D-aminoacyl-tRNA deacylase [Thermoplasmataceae archaeon]